MRLFTLRNLKIFFRDKAAVFFSLMAVFIIIALYALFLGDVWTQGYEGLTGVRFLMDRWIMAGLLAVASVSTTMGAFGVMVEDKMKKINKDFAVSPISGRRLAGGYILSAYLIGVIMSLCTLLVGEVYIVASGGAWLSMAARLQVVLLLLLTVMANTAMVLFMVSFFKSNNAFSTAASVVGTFIGFLTGVYLPIGTLPEGVQWVVKLFPVSHAAVLLRQVMMKEPLAATFAGAPTQVVADFNNTMGATFQFGGGIATPLTSILVLVGTAAVFFLLSALNLSRKTK